MKVCCSLIMLGLLTMAWPARNASKTIVIVLDEQRLYAVSQLAEAPSGLPGVKLTAFHSSEHRVVFFCHCSTGRRGMATPVGQTTVQSKAAVGQALAEFGGEALYDVLRIHLYDPHQKRVRRIDIHAFPRVPNYPASHGCVRLKKSGAERLFGWTPVGTKVLVVRHRPSWLAIGA